MVDYGEICNSNCIEYAKPNHHINILRNTYDCGDGAD